MSRLVSTRLLQVITVRIIMTTMSSSNNKLINYYLFIRLGTAAAALCATGVGSDGGNVDFNFAVSLTSVIISELLISTYITTYLTKDYHLFLQLLINKKRYNNSLIIFQPTYFQKFSYNNPSILIVRTLLHTNLTKL